MKNIKLIIAGILVMGSLTMVGCDDVKDTSGVVDEGSVTETEGKNLEDHNVMKAEEDFNSLNENDSAFDLQLVANTAIANFNDGAIDDIETYIGEYVHLMYENGSVVVGDYKLTAVEAKEMLLYTIGSSQNYTVNDLETKKKCAIAGLKNIIAWEKNINTESLEFQEQSEINGQIIFFIMQGHATVGRAIYEPATGNVGYEINIAK